MTRIHHYFAYGSNLLARRLEARVPVLADLGCHRLDGYTLRFHKRGRDGSGKGDVVATRDAGARVHGAVYRLDDDALAKLNVIEGVGAGYRLEAIRLPGLPDCVCYVAEETAIDPALQPYTWYLALVVAGARARGCPVDYVQWLAQTPAVIDTDLARTAAAYRLLDGDEDTLGHTPRYA